MQWFRGRPSTVSQRFPECLTGRTQPPPDIPGGPNHKISKVYYFSRDARREVDPPVVITALEKQITVRDQTSTKLQLIAPGKVPVSQSI